MRERIEFLHRNRIFSLIIWLIALFAAIVLMQNTTTTIQQSGQPQLPNDSQPVIAQGMQRDWGRQVGNTYTITAVFNKTKGQIEPDDQANIDKTVTELQSRQKFYGIKSVQTLATNPAAQGQYLSADKSTQLVQISIDRKQGDLRVITKQLQGQMKTTGFKTYVTSPEILNDATNQKISQTTTVATIVLFILALIIMGILFKSIVAPIIATLAILMSYAVSLSLVNNLATRLHFAYSEYTPLMILIITILLGIFGHFILYRWFSENIDAGESYDNATRNAVAASRYFLIVVSLTLAVIFAGFAIFKFSTLRAVANLAIPVVLTLLATLTITPIFMNLLGDRFFWPAVSTDVKEHTFWYRMTSFGLWQPIVAIIAVAYFVGPFAYAYRDNLSFNAPDALETSQQAVTGMQVLNAHFTQGKATPVTIYVQSKDRLDSQKALLQLDNLTTKLQSMPGVSSVTSLTQPNGQPIAEYYVNNQLNDFSIALKGTTDQLDDLRGSIKDDGANLNRVKLDADAERIESLAQTSTQLMGDTNTVNSQVNEIAGRANIKQKRSASKRVRRYQRLLRLINTQLLTVATNMRTLSTEISTNQSNANAVRDNLNGYETQIKDVQSSLKKTSKSMKGLVKSYTDIYNYLSALQASDAAKIYYLTPEQLTSADFQQALLTNTSENYKTTTLTVTFKNTNSAQATKKTVDHLQDEVATQLQGTALKSAKVAYAGQPIVQSTIQESVQSQYGWIALLVLGLFLVALALVSRSILQPVYWLLTLGLSAVAATQLAQLTVNFLFGQTAFNWQVPLMTLVPVLVIGVTQLIQVGMTYRKNDPWSFDWVLPSLTEMGQTLRYRLFTVLAFNLGLLFTGFIPVVTVGWITIYTVLIFNVSLPILIAAFSKLTVNLPQSQSRFNRD